MIDGKHIVVVMPAYNAARTLEKTVAEVNRQLVDHILVVDDASEDATVEVAKRLGLEVVVHDRNCGYGGNQKTCYSQALRMQADVVVMLHPDYQYSPKLLAAMSSPIASGEFDVMLGSRILVGGALSFGMPLYKYIGNRFLTGVENLFAGATLSEYHTGYRAFSRRVLEALPLGENSDDFLFDAQMLAQCLYFGFRIGEVSCPARYEPDSSSIGFRKSVLYGLGVLRVTAQLALARRGLLESRTFPAPGRSSGSGDGPDRRPTRRIRPGASNRTDTAR